MGITTTDMKGPAEPESSITKGDERAIKFRESSRIEGRKPGRVYVVDSALAHHYCDVLGVADLTTETSGDPPPVATPQKTTDRAMKPPPRGRRS